MAANVLQNPPIYHITHVANLASILTANGLWSDSQIRAMDLKPRNIGYPHIKERRLLHPVTVSNNGHVGDYVPFNFCPRSIMLWRVWRGHDAYQEGQRPIVHLVSNVDTVVKSGRPWFFTDGHADMVYPGQYDDLARLDEVDWSVMPIDFWWGGDQDAQHRKNAEFLVHEFCPWNVVQEIAVLDEGMATVVQEAIAGASHKPAVVVRPNWYY